MSRALAYTAVAVVAFVGSPRGLYSQNCPGCTGSAGFICSSGYPECVNSTWDCQPGAGKCIMPMPNGCHQGSEQWVCTTNGWQCQGSGSPIVIDVSGQGFHITGFEGGVRYTFFPNNPAVQIAWTDPAYSNGWLALDRNGNGKIDDATELFGNLTIQPPSPNPNGYLALAVFDNTENGGNENGVIDPEDAVFERLRIWIDANHNGISEPQELHSLRELGISKIGLKYKYTPYVDPNGNQYRYKGTIWDAAGKARDACYDVFLKFIK